MRNDRLRPHHLSRSAIRSSGLTLVELLVAMVLMGLVTLATVTLYSVSSSSYRTTDASQELDDNARFAFEVIGQAIRQAGYQEFSPKGLDDVTGGNVYPTSCSSATIPFIPCPIIGANNAKVASVTNIDDFGTTNNGGVNASDTLGVTFAGSSKLSNVTVADGSILDCQGVAQPTPQTSGTGQGLQNSGLGLSLFWVTTSASEPELSCISISSSGVRNSQPLVRGVETFQVMYGLDTDGDGVANRWVSAQSVSNWMLVRAVRVGLVLRSAPGSSQGTAPSSTNLYPLGQDFTGPSAETGLIFTPPNDTRMRRAYATTYLLRNEF
ncbi:MAG: PilW family protein [Ramlibacter sp.]|nr:PilW family protein [Ramlibacter sp.]